MKGAGRALFPALLVLASLAAGCASVRSYERPDHIPGRPSGSESPRSKPYTIRGKTYYPYETADNFSQTGVASWYGPAYKGIPLAVSTAIALTAGHNMTVGYTFDRKEKKDHGDGGWMVGTPLTDGMKVLLVDDVMTAGTAVREVIPKLKAEANVEVVGLVLSVDRMEKTKDSDMSAVKAVEAEFGFPVLSIANVREIFDAAAKMKNPDGTPLLSHDIQQRAAAYLEEYGA